MNVADWAYNFFLTNTILSYVILFGSCSLEGLTIPCPSMIILIIGGSILDPSWPLYIIMFVLCSITYTVSALVPYYVGRFFKDRAKKKEAKYHELFDRLFKKYGQIAVCITRPLWIGNLISYFAGMAKMNVPKFLGLTFLGILPWHLSVMAIGKILGDNIEYAIDFAQKYTFWFTVIMVFILASGTIISWLIKKYVTKKIIED